MQLKTIDKTRYRKHLNIVILGFITTLLVLSLVYGSLLIKVFSNVVLTEQSTTTAISTPVQNAEGVNDATTTETPADIKPPTINEAPENTNFKYNFLGVVLALLSCGVILNKLKTTAFFSEIYYVWQVKQVQNKIFRKLKVIKNALKNDDEKAMLVLTFYYEGLKQIYLLDDNTITMPTVYKDIEKLEAQIAAKAVDINIEDFDVEMVKSFVSTGV